MGVDVITDFTPTGGNGDAIAIGSTLTFDQLTLTQQGDNTLIHIATTEELLAVLNGINANSLNNSHFMLIE
jgi:hypothetical protein